MLRHIVLVRWLPEATEARRESVRRAIAALPSQIPEIAALKSGDGIGAGSNHYDFAAVLDFADRDAWQRYIQHPAHRAYAEGPGKEAVGSLACVQHEW
jgi:hypothetical protein